MYFVDLVFIARRKILSLPPWHGARWSAWLRGAARLAGIRLEAVAAAIMPFRHGQKPILPNEQLGLRLLVPPDGLFLLPGLLASLKQPADVGEFCSGSLELVCACDAISGLCIWADCKPSGAPLKRFGEEAIAEELRLLQNLVAFTMRFPAPLRLPWKPRGKFALPGDIVDARGLASLLARVRFIGSVQLALPGLKAHYQHLAWKDMRYSSERKIALGGIVGEICWHGSPDQDLARRLVLGQYFGAGKNGRFGLGFWQIPELACARKIRLG